MVEGNLTRSVEDYLTFSRKFTQGAKGGAAHASKKLKGALKSQIGNCWSTLGRLLTYLYCAHKGPDHVQVNYSSK